MKDGNLTILYTNETRKFMRPATEQAEQAEQQSNRAAE
jgi:hypothetical protein